MTRRASSSASLPLLVVVFGLWFVASFGDPLLLTTMKPIADYDDDTTKFLVDHGAYQTYKEISVCEKFCPGKCTIHPQSNETLCICGRGKGIKIVEYIPTCKDCYCGEGEISCTFDISGFKRCFCEAGYEIISRKCVKSIDETEKTPCENKPCHNGGVCWEQNDHNTSYMCECPQTHTGKNCEQALNACNLNPCRNGGVCWYGKSFRYLCVCQKNYTGKNCEREIHICDSKPCFNGGTCYRGNGSDYFCSCHETHTGKNCETAITPCDSKPCKNGGTCWMGEDTNYMCTCLNDYGGKNCDKKKSIPTSPVTSTTLFS